MDQGPIYKSLYFGQNYSILILHAPPMSKQHLYIIDDDQSFGRSLKRLLTCKGYRTDYFPSAQAFIDSVPSGQKGVAIVDLHMPECDGLELIDIMRELQYDMPVVLITGQTQADSRDTALQRGARGFLQKPFNEASLIALIEGSETAMTSR